MYIKFAIFLLSNNYRNLMEDFRWNMATSMSWWPFFHWAQRADNKLIKSRLPKQVKRTPPLLFGHSVCWTTTNVERERCASSGNLRFRSPTCRWGLGGLRAQNSHFALVFAILNIRCRQTYKIRCLCSIMCTSEFLVSLSKNRSMHYGHICYGP